MCDFRVLQLLSEGLTPYAIYNDDVILFSDEPVGVEYSIYKEYFGLTHGSGIGFILIVDGKYIPYKDYLVAWKYTGESTLNY